MIYTLKHQKGPTKQEISSKKNEKLRRRSRKLQKQRTLS